MYIVTKIGADWSIFTDAIVYTKSTVAIFQIQGQITQDLMVRYIFTKVGAD